MALINCPDCNKEVSDRAEICLNCGAPIAPKKSIVDDSRENTFQDVNLNEKFNKVFEEEKKSPGVAVLLAFIFGPFGTFYSSVGAGIVMVFVYLFSLFGSFAGVFFASIVNMFICYFFATEANEKLKAEILIRQNKKVSKDEKNLNSSVDVNLVDPKTNSIASMFKDVLRCKTCKGELREGATVCSKCGTKIDL